MLKKEKQRKARKIIRVRKNIKGTAERPRMSVFRSLNHIYVQIIDDSSSTTLAAVSTKSKNISSQLKSAKSKTEQSKIVGSEIARVAQEKGVSKVMFDRGIYRFHGRVKALAESAREGGLKF